MLEEERSYTFRYTSVPAFRRPHAAMVRSNNVRLKLWRVTPHAATIGVPIIASSHGEHSVQLPRPCPTFALWVALCTWTVPACKGCTTLYVCEESSHRRCACSQAAFTPHSRLQQCPLENFSMSARSIMSADSEADDAPIRPPGAASPVTAANNGRNASAAAVGAQRGVSTPPLHGNGANGRAAVQTVARTAAPRMRELPVVSDSRDDVGDSGAQGVADPTPRAEPPLHPSPPAGTPQTGAGHFRRRSKGDGLTISVGDEGAGDAPSVAAVITGDSLTAVAGSPDAVSAAGSDAQASISATASFLRRHLPRSASVPKMDVQESDGTHHLGGGVEMLRGASELTRTLEQLAAKCAAHPQRQVVVSEDVLAQLFSYVATIALFPPSCEAVRCFMRRGCCRVHFSSTHAVRVACLLVPACLPVVLPHVQVGETVHGGSGPPAGPAPARAQHQEAPGEGGPRAVRPESARLLAPKLRPASACGPHTAQAGAPQLRLGVAA